jgi:hypothetical protein
MSNTRVRGWLIRAFVLAAFGLGIPRVGLAQFGIPSGSGGGAGAFLPPQPVGPAPQMPVGQPGWAQVITVTPKWLVLQNERGQQFPVAVDGIRMFLMRWPTSPDRLGPQSLVEVTGVDLGSYQAQTDHVDVYEGAAQSLVQPGHVRITSENRVTTDIDYVFDSNVYGEAFPSYSPTVMNPAGNGLPPRLHAVGTVVNQFPLRLVVPGGHTVQVIPSANGLSMTQVSPGSFSMVRPGDVAFFYATAAGAKSLDLSQLVVYKPGPMN